MEYITSAVAEELREQQRISDDELFASRSYFSFLSEVLTAYLAGGKSQLSRLCSKVSVQLDCEADEHSPMTAFTDGRIVHVNTKSDIAWNMPTRWLRYVGDVGLIVHECGHIFFTDFTVWNPTLDNWMKGYYANAYTDPQKVQDLAGLMDTDSKRAYFLKIARQIQNITEDVYIENRLFTVFAGVPAIGLRQNALSIYSGAPSMDVRLKRIGAGKSLAIDECIGLFLLKARGFDMKDGKCSRTDPDYRRMADFIDQTSRPLKALEWETDAVRRAALVLDICWLLIPFLKEVFQNAEKNPQQNQNSESGRTSGQQNRQPNSGQGQSSSQQSGCGREQMPSVGNYGSAIPKGNTAPVDSGRKLSQSEKQAGSKGRTLAQNTSKESVEAQAKAELNRYEREQAEASAEARQLKQIRNEAGEIRRRLQKESNASVEYRLEQPYKDRDSYRNLFKQVSTVSAALKRMLDRVLRERKEGGTQRNAQKGKFDSRSYAHNIYGSKPLYFRNRKDPSGDPDCAFAIVIDESGSMSGPKIAKAAAAGILLDDVSRHINVPAMVVGHDARGFTDCRIDVYRDFDYIDESEKYRLGNMRSDYCNMDAGVIAFCGERLLKRKEKQKVIFVISDGAPTRTGVHGREDPETDTRMTVEEYTRKGITIFGIVIDDDYDRIRSIYGDRTLDARELKDLPVNMGTLMKRLIIRSIR